MSTPYLALKFLISSTEVRVIHVDQKEAWRCYHESLREKGKKSKKRRNAGGAYGGNRSAHEDEHEGP